jgi:signal peptidase II
VRQRYLFTGSMVGVLVILDIVTKQWALRALDHGYTVQALDGWLPLTLAFNRGIAFGLGIPGMGRWLLVVASAFIIIVLSRLLAQARDGDNWRVLAIGLVMAGAVGNLVDRVRWERGVVDFIGPYNLGFMHWPIFNVADMAITTGAVILGVSLLLEEREIAAEERARSSNSAVVRER